MSNLSNPVEVRMIWARVQSEPEAPYLIDAWDEYSIDQNYDGWREAVAKAGAEKENEVRVVTCFLDYDAVVNAFGPTRVEVEG